MSTISTTPRRPSTALPTLNTLNTRMSYSDGEALLWERQNARFHTHLSQQLKDLQTQHSAYEARIAATEAIAEAAEAAVMKVRELERKVKAIEEEEGDRPLDRWVKEAVGQLQGRVEGLKGVRGRIAGVEMKVDRLEEGEGERLRELLRRVEVLEREREERGDGCHQPIFVDEDVQDTIDEGIADDNPLAVFYGIDTQSPVRRQQSPARPQQSSPGRQQLLSKRQQTAPREIDSTGRNQIAHRHDHTTRESTQSPRRQHGFTGDLQPPDEELAFPEADSLDLLDAAPEVNYGFENTQRFKDMQRELEELRAMCRSQDTKSSNNTADATQRLQETQIIPRKNNMGFSDATTETEMEVDDPRPSPPRVGPSRGEMDMPSSDIPLPSSPPKRTETQSARRKLMKRASINDPRIPSMNDNERNSKVEPVQEPRASLLVRLPVDTGAGPGKVPAKRKHDDDSPVQRGVRAKLSDKTTAAKKPAASSSKKAKANLERTVEAAIPAADDKTPAHPLSTRKTFGKSKQGVDHTVQPPVPQAGSMETEQADPAADSTVSAVEVVKTRKAVGKPKSASKKPVQQTAAVPATTSASKASAAVKKESKATRQPNGACKSCRARHQKCDRTLPSCGRCAKGGLSCEYFSSTGPASSRTTASSKKKQALLPVKKAADEADREDVLRGRSETVGPEAPRQQSTAKRPLLASSSKKPTVAAEPTAASSRAPRAKNTQIPKSSTTQKKKQK